VLCLSFGLPKRISGDLQVDDLVSREWDEIFGIATDAPLDEDSEFDTEEENDTSSKLPWWRKGDCVRPSALQKRYQKQIKSGRQVYSVYTKELDKMVAWTWMPGLDRQTCPPIVNLRDARLIVMDRFPDEHDSHTHIALSMYRSTIDKHGCVTYAGPSNVEMFKDLSLRPYKGAGGLILDSDNEDVLRTALLLDKEMRLVQRNCVQPTDTFDPPQVLIGFPYTYHPLPEWKAPMKAAVKEAFSQGSSVLKYLLSPGGSIVDVTESINGFRTIKINLHGHLHIRKIPSWVIIQPNVQKDAVIKEGDPLGDLPRKTMNKITDLTSQYPFPSIEWVMRRILDDCTETYDVEENMYDQRAQAYRKQQMRWTLVPHKYVQTQTHRATRYYMDFRAHLGRQRYVDAASNCVTIADQCKMFVKRFPSRPCVDDLKFRDHLSEKEATWFADMITQPQSAPWTSKCKLRGIVNE